MEKADNVEAPVGNPVQAEEPAEVEAAKPEQPDLQRLATETPKDLLLN